MRKPKDALIYDVLKRWWYALPDWPPANYDYQPSLEANKLRLISKQKFRIAPDLDDKGTHKLTKILKNKNRNIRRSTEQAHCLLFLFCLTMFISFLKAMPNATRS